MTPHGIEIYNYGDERYKKRVAKEQVELMEEVTKLVETNPMLREQLIMYIKAKDTYENKRAVKFELN